MMKKFLSMLLAVVMAIGMTAALADSVTLEPLNADPLEAIATGNCTVMAHFDPESAFDDLQQMTFTVTEDDLYPAEAVKALKSGDRVVVCGEAYDVHSVHETEEGLVVNGDNDGSIIDFYYTDSDARDMLYCSDADIPFRTEVGTFTIPMADQVKVSVWHEEENGIPSQEMDEVTLAAADVQAFLMARSDESRTDYLNFTGNHVTVQLQEGKVTGIRIDWGSDD